MGQGLGLVPEQEVDVAGRGLLLQQPEPQAGAVDRARVLPTLEAVPRPAPAVAPFRSTTLRWPGEIVSPLRAATSAASRARVHARPVGDRGRQHVPGHGERRLALARRPPRPRPGAQCRDPAPSGPPSASASPARRRTPRRAAITALISPSSDHSTARARSASRRAAERLSRSSSARAASSTTNPHRRPWTVLLACCPADPALVRVHLKSCLAAPPLPLRIVPGGQRLVVGHEAQALLRVRRDRRSAR